MFFIELVHQMRVCDQQQDEAEDGTLLGHPKSEGSSADGVLVQFFLEQDSASEGYEKPNDEKSSHQSQARFPV